MSYGLFFTMTFVSYMIVIHVPIVLAQSTTALSPYSLNTVIGYWNDHCAEPVGKLIFHSLAALGTSK
jgi:hypothetical protein